MQDLGENRPQPQIRDRGVRELSKRANKLERLKVVLVSPDDLKPNSYNPNRQAEKDFELLIKSMTEDGFTQPIVALIDGTIVDGEHRWRASKKLNYTKIPVVYVDMTLEQARIATLRHNRARGSEDVELSAGVLRDLIELGAMDWAKDSLSLSDEEVENLLNDLPATDALAGDDFSESYMFTPANPDQASVKSIELDRGQNFASSEKTIEKLEEYKEQIAQETDEGRKVELTQELNKNIFRVSVSYSNEEAELVKKVLGNTPAEKLLSLSKELLGIS